MSENDVQPPGVPFARGVTVMPEWFAHEGVDAVLDRVQALGATAIATSPYVLERVADGEGAREPPPDGEAGKVRPLDRDLFGARELFVRTAPSFTHNLARYRGLAYQPSPATALTQAKEDVLDRMLASASRRGIHVYMQVMAACPPGYRVQFSGARAEDQCLQPDGSRHDARVDRNASLASRDVVAYTAALACDIAARYPGVTGIRLDWPEYPPYDFRSALFDFNPAMAARMAASGHDPSAVARNVLAWAERLRDAVRSAAPSGAQAVLRALDDADFDALFADDGRLAPLLDAKRAAARDLLASVRTALDGLPGPRRRLEPHAFPPPFSRMSGFPLGDLADIADAIGIKLYTMHWPMIARYWARDLLGPGDGASHDAVTAAIAFRFGFTDALVPDGNLLRYPEPATPHPVGMKSQAAKLATAKRLAGRVPAIAFVHSYGPVDDVVHRRDIAAASGLPVWINRYGYLSDEKIAALAPRRP
ncbi:MAG: hypothetical protein U1F54_00620 [Burkholderiales bacterium]